MMRLFPGALLATSVLWACESGHAVITGDSLTIDPCVQGQPRTWRPFRMEMDRLTWNRPDEDVGILTMQAGFRDPNRTDLVVLEFRDPSHLEAQVQQRPGWETTLPEAGRVSLSLKETCPDGREPLQTRTGRIRLERFDLSFGGGIAGMAWFDLQDPRKGDDFPAVGAGMVLDFSVDLTEKDPRTGGGRR